MNFEPDTFEREYPFELPLAALCVAKCCLDSGVVLYFGDSKDTLSLRFEGRAVLHTRGTQADLNPQEPETLGPVLTLVGKTVVTAMVAKEGSVEITFTGGS